MDSLAFIAGGATVREFALTTMRWKYFQTLRSALLRLPIEWRERRRWRDAAAAGRNARVFFGFDRLPAAATLSGGLVKVIDLQTAFPNCPRGANILYLISSALPVCAERMARRARAAGAKVVLNQNGVAYPGWHGAGWERTNRPMADLLRHADYVFYQSRFCRESANRFAHARTDASEILYNPVDTRLFTPAPRDPAPGALVCLLAGSHEFLYRVQVAVDTVARLRAAIPSARLCIAGRYTWRPHESEALAELRAYIARQGLTDAVEIRGAFAPHDAAALLQSAHILLHTKYNDPSPRLVVEAMACGLPVVYSATGGTPELVGADAGVGVPGPRDWERDHPPAPEALAAALATVAGGRERYARAARARAAASLDVQPWLERHRTVFAALLAPAPAEGRVA